MGNLGKQYKFMLLKTEYDQFTHSFPYKGTTGTKMEQSTWYHICMIHVNINVIQ